MNAHEIEYPDDFLNRLEIVWGKGFLSPGGAEEVTKIVEGVNIAGQTVLDFGCGTGGPALVLANGLNAEKIIAIDVEEGVLARAKANAADAGAADRIDFRLVEPGPLPLPENSIDVVFSKDAMIHILDKQAMFKDVLRVLRPGGVFAASDWLGGENASTSPDLARYRELGHLSFTMATAPESKAAMRAAGFSVVTAHDRNEWYAEVCAEEVRQIEGPLREPMLKVVDGDIYAHWLNVRRALADSVAAGALRPTHLRGYKP